MPLMYLRTALAPCAATALLVFTQVASAQSAPSRAPLRGTAFVSKTVGTTPAIFFVRWELDTSLGEPTVYCDAAWFVAEDAPLPGGGTVGDLSVGARKDLVLTDVDVAIDLARGKASLGTVSCDVGALRSPIVLRKFEAPQSRWRDMSDRDKESQLSFNIRSSPNWSSTLDSPGGAFASAASAKAAFLGAETTTPRIKSAQGVFLALQLERARRDAGIALPDAQIAISTDTTSLQHKEEAPSPGRPVNEAARVQARKDVATYEASLATARKAVAARERIKEAAILVDATGPVLPGKPFTLGGKLRGIDKPTSMEIEVDGVKRSVVPHGNTWDTRIELPKGQHAILVRTKVEGVTMLRRVELNVDQSCTFANSVDLGKTLNRGDGTASDPAKWTPAVVGGCYRFDVSFSSATLKKYRTSLQQATVVPRVNGVEASKLDYTLFSDDGRVVRKVDSASTPGRIESGKYGACLPSHVVLRIDSVESCAPLGCKDSREGPHKFRGGERVELMPTGSSAFVCEGPAVSF